MRAVLDGVADESLWKRYLGRKRNNKPGRNLRDKLVERYLGLANAAAIEARRNLPPWFDGFAIIGAAHDGLLYAVTHYDPDRGSVTFTTYAMTIIKQRIAKAAMRESRNKPTESLEGIYEQERTDPLCERFEEITAGCTVRERLVLFLRYHREMDFEAVAQVLGVAVVDARRVHDQAIARCRDLAQLG